MAARDIYQKNCGSCHGQYGEGMEGVVDFTTPTAVATLTRAEMIAALSDRHGPDLRARWESTIKGDIAADIVDYIRDALMLPAPLADASVGRKIYARRCSVCHGDRGDGASWARNGLNPPPANFTSPRVKAKTRRELIHIVLYGNPGTAMMPFATRFSREEIAAVVDYIRQNFMRVNLPQIAHGSHAAAPPHHHDAERKDTHHHDAERKNTHHHDAEAKDTHHHGATAKETHQSKGEAPALARRGREQAKDHAHHGHGGEFDFDAPFPNGLRGDFERGKRFYGATCAECHGHDGKGDGRRAYFMSYKPENFTSRKAREVLNRPHLFEATAKGVERTEMPAWSKVIDDQQIADVAEYVFRAFIRPEPGGGRPGPDWREIEKKK